MEREILTGGDAPKTVSDCFPKTNANDWETAFHRIYVSNANKIFKCILFKILEKKKRKEANRPNRITEFLAF